MKKFLLGLVSLVIVLTFSATARADVNDFIISDYQIDLYLGRDEQGRSTLRTRDWITAQFPSFDQNHGIERAIPTTYDHHTTSLKLDGVRDGNLKNLEYSTSDENENKVVRIGDADTFVHGTQVYAIEYSQRDVTRNVDTSGATLDEFYWDTNGVDWRVPIEKLSVKVHIDDALRSELAPNNSCYVGFANETQSCTLNEKDGVFEATATDLKPHQNVTVAFGFNPGTFAAYQPSLLEQLVNAWGILMAAIAPIALAIIGWLTVRWSRIRNRKNEVGTIVPEYLPPKNISVTAAAEVLDSPRNVMTAQILDLAVRHFIKIIQTREKSTFKKAEYDLEIIKPIDTLLDEEQELLRDLFDGQVAVGSSMSMKTLQSSAGFYTRMQNNPDKLKKQVRGEYALRSKSDEHSATFKRVGWIVLVLSFITLSPLLLIAAIVSFVLGATLWRLTDKGLETRRYLLGLKDYIQVAETERIKMLQSPEGAEKVGEDVAAENPAQLVKLYEKVLPYAVLFGQEKEWNKQLGAYYETTQTQPSWYAGNNAAFNAAAFSSTMNSFSSSANYISPSNSSSGGSGGGGFSGGGGGGGGGGGW